jgi:hypothetical protein
MDFVVDQHPFSVNIDDPDWILEKPISIFALDQADRRVLKVADQRDAVQKETFTKWINFHLAKRNGLHVDDLYLDLRDGQLLTSLLEIFTNQTMVSDENRRANARRTGSLFSRVNVVHRSSML